MRHVVGGTWFPLDDDLLGVDLVGNPYYDHHSWSLNFEEKVPDFDEFLFATVDCAKWLITTKFQAIGEKYFNQG